ncbi:MAG: helix-turn-helix transcriptional regulator [Treponema sp.]|nr:helix-turn-helix transcriptional regulator [Treponema sp.]
MLAFLQRQPVPFVPPVFQKLSKREQEVAVLLLQGKTTQETADALFVSLSTVKTHIQHIYEKTGVRNRAELARLTQNHVNG